MKAVMPARTFKALFCEQYQCPETDYEAQAFAKCLRWQGRVFSPLVRKMRPDHFAIDEKFIRNLGAVTGLREAHREVQDYGDAIRARQNFLRTGLKVRVSGSKALTLADRLFRPR